MGIDRSIVKGRDGGREQVKASVINARLVCALK